MSGPAGRSGARRTRAASYAANPSEPVLAPVVMSTLLPHTSGQRYHTYRYVLLAMVAVTLVGCIVGQLGFALVTAALTVPIFYVLYMLDLNVWEDQPALVLGLVAVLSGLVGAAVATLVRSGLHLSMQATTGLIDWRELFRLDILWPIVALILMQAGPVLLSMRRRFNHMLDGLTFGVLSGSSFLAGDTLVAHHGVFSRVTQRGTTSSLGSWIPIMLNSAIVRPLIFGALTAIAAAEFCGIGTGVGRFTQRYARTLAEIVIDGVIYSVGVAFLGLVDGAAGLTLTLLWGVVVLVAVVFRLRTRLHDALLEEAADAIATGAAIHDHAPGRTSCTNCSSAIDGDRDHFCGTCGMATLASSKSAGGPPRPPDDPPAGSEFVSATGSAIEGTLHHV